VNAREELHRLVDELGEAEVEAVLTRLLCERETVEDWVAPATEDAWARGNAREAIREEPW
jgi:hypothetical protein